MRKLVFVLLIVLSIMSCELRFPSYLTNQYDSNPFLKYYDLFMDIASNSNRLFIDDDRASVTKDLLRFVAITDVHIGRDQADSGVRFFHDNFYSYLDSKMPEFIMCLGDLSDDGRYSKDVVNFVIKSASKTINKWFLYCIGNHERHVFDKEKWNPDSDLDPDDFTVFDVKHFRGTIALYCYGDALSIYKLDNSMRVLGKKQLAWFEESLKKDKSKYKMVIVHDNIMSGGAFDQSLFLTGFADVQERNKFLALLDKYNVGLVLSGHHHKGNIEYKVNDHLSELNLAAYHQRRVALNLESEGYFYECLLDVKSGNLIINGFLAENTDRYDKKPDVSYSYKLPSSK